MLTLRLTLHFNSMKLQKFASFTISLLLILGASAPLLSYAAVSGGGNTTGSESGNGNTTGSNNGGGNTTGSVSGGGNTTGSAPMGLQNPLKNIGSLPDLINALLDAVVDIGIIIVTLALVYIGFLFVAAQGNEEKLRNARAALMWTLIGGLILLGAKAISEVIQATVGKLTV